jgi:FemAB-related protein (PEP-CTERM system-associated)
MTSIKIAKQTDCKMWDNFLSSQKHAWPYHLYGWGNAIFQTYKHKPYYLIAEDNNKITGVLPLIHFKFPCLVNNLIALPYCDVGNYIGNNDVTFKELLNKALEIGEELKVKEIELRGSIQCNAHKDFSLSKGKINKVRMFLNLPDSSDALLASFKSKLRSQIRKSKKNGISFRWGGEADIDSFYTVFSENMRDLGSPVHARAWFHSILSNLHENARIGIVELEKQVVGGCIILMLNDKVSIPWASTLRKYNNLAPNMQLYWNVLKFSCDNGYRIIDFGRSTVGEGTYKFKAQWGAAAEPLEWYTIINKENEENYNNDTKYRYFFERCWSNLPVKFTNYLGPKIRRNISL